VSARCPERIGTSVLVDYWFGDLSVPEQDRVEEHLMACSDCGRVLGELVAVGEGVRRLASRGAFHVVVSPSFLDAASSRGLRIREYRVSPGGGVACTVTAEDDLVVSRLGGDFTGIARVDLVAQTEGRPEERVLDLPVDPSAHELIVAHSMPVLRAMGTCVTRLRLVVPEPGGDRLLGEYTFNHTPSAS
jgi:hypothetical protein